MDANFDVSDSTDWLPTSLPLLAPLDSALRCQVCKDFYDTPMITSCSHTFCSLCIRKCLSSDGRCPACREQDQASKLRRNWTVQEVVDSFKMARPQVLDIAKKAKEDASRGVPRANGTKRKRDDVDGHDEVAGSSQKSARQTRSQSRKSTETISSQNVVVLDSEGDEDYQPEGEAAPRQHILVHEDGLVPCPVCGTRMKEGAVFAHLDHCDGRPVQPHVEARQVPISQPQIAYRSQETIDLSRRKYRPLVNRLQLSTYLDYHN